MAQLQVITGCTRRGGMLALYEEQLSAAGIPLHIEPLTEMPNGVGNLGFKIAQTRALVERFRHCEKLVISDAWDVVFYGTAEQVFNKVPGAGVLFAGERNCWPDAYLAPHVPGTTPWRFPNGGLWCGTPESLLQWMEDVERHPEYIAAMVDQQWMCHRLVKHDPIVQLDSTTKLFYCAIFDQGELQCEHGLPVNTLTKEHPNFIHFNGKTSPAGFFVRREQSLNPTKVVEKPAAKRPNKVFFAIPSYAGLTHKWGRDKGKPRCADFINALAKTRVLFEQKHIQTEIGMEQGNCYIDCARSSLVERFLETDCDVLFFVDDDVSWQAEDALKLVETDAPVVAGIYRNKIDGERYPVVIHTDESFIPIVREDGCIKAANLPTGFLAIRREVLEKIRLDNPALEYDEYKDGEKVGTRFLYFPQGLDNRRWWGEDFAFSNLCAKSGFEMWIQPDITLTHHGDKPYTGNYHQFLLRQPGGSECKQSA